jgi:DNA-directed DNA polymerase III PolC
MFVASPHTHVESPITGSSVDSMIERAVELGRTHFSYTDPAYMTSCLSAYEKAKKKKLKFIPGVEIFFKDPNCTITKGTRSEQAKYFKLTLHATDQAAYQKLCELSSKERSEKIVSYGSEFSPWNWKDLEECLDFNILACSSDANDIAAKHLFTGRPDLAEQIILKLKAMFGNKYYVAVVGNKMDKTWASFVEFTFQDGSKMILSSSDRVRTPSLRMGISPKEVAQNSLRHSFVSSVIKSGIYTSVNKVVSNTKIHEGNLRLPQGDPQLKANLLMVGLANRHSIPIIYSDYAYYSSPKDKGVQDVRLSQDGIKEYSPRHMQTREEAFEYLTDVLKLNSSFSEQILKNNVRWASNFDNFSFSYDYSVPEIEGNRDAIRWAMEIIASNGRMRWDNPAYVDRLRYELEILAKNGKVDLLPYFFPIRDVLNFYKENNQLTGPARGSAAGSLFMYLMGITQVDPIKYGLSFERFLSLDRILTGNWPDVDVDLVDRTLLVGEDGRSGYLYGRWGSKAAQISTRIMLRLKSSIKDVNRYFKGAVEPEIEKLSKSLPPPPQGVSDKDFVFGFEDDDGNRNAGLIEVNADLKKYAQERPEEWDLVVRCLGIARQHSKHASAFVIANKPVSSIVPMFMGNITQYEAKAVEKAKLIKYDFLVVNQLKDIQKCIELINKKNEQKLEPGKFVHKGADLFIWDLPEDPDVFASIWEGETSTLFQINTRSMVPFVQRILPKSIEDLSSILALVRPGPLDFIDPTTNRNMAEEYIERRRGNSKPDMKELAELLPETYGIMVYQEQVSKVSRILGDMKAGDAEELRRVFSKKDKKKSLEMKPLFMEGAVKKVGQEKAETLWSMMETFSRYGFNKSHSVSYAMITYACMYLKYYYPLEWWAAVLSNADEEEISNELYKYVKDIVSPPDINLSTNEMIIDYKNNTVRAKLTVLKGLGEKAVDAIVSGRPYLNIKDFVRKRVAGPSLTKKLIHVGVMDSLFPAKHDLLHKMQDYEDAVKQVEYEEKLARGVKAKEPKRGDIDPYYLSMHPIVDFVEKKSIYPTMPGSLYEVMIKHCKRVQEGSDYRAIVSNSRHQPVRFVSGKESAMLDSLEPTNKDLEFCCAGYVVSCEEFSFSKNTKKALKMVIDSDGYQTERVIWPDYETEKLAEYPGLTKGAVGLFFLTKRANKETTKVSDVVIIYSPLQDQKNKA